jgi:hypothetical protein
MTRLEPTPRVGRRQIAAWSSTLVLVLVGFSAERPTSNAAALSRQDERAASRLDTHCSLTQKTPLFVAFARGMALDDFEQAAKAASEILRSLKGALCSAPNLGHADVLLPSIRSALVAHAPLQSREVRFDDRDLGHAHVVLSQLRHAPRAAQNAHDSHDVDLASLERTWQVHLEHGATNWLVTHSEDVAIAQILKP